MIFLLVKRKHLVSTLMFLFLKDKTLKDRFEQYYIANDSKTKTMFYLQNFSRNIAIFI